MLIKTHRYFAKNRCVLRLSGQTELQNKAAGSARRDEHFPPPLFCVLKEMGTHFLQNRGFPKGAQPTFGTRFCVAKSSVLCLPCRLTGKLAPPPYGRGGFERQESRMNFANGSEQSSFRFH